MNAHESRSVCVCSFDRSFFRSCQLMPIRLSIRSYSILIECSIIHKMGYNLQLSDVDFVKNVSGIGGLQGPLKSNLNYLVCVDTIVCL